MSSECVVNANIARLHTERWMLNVRNYFLDRSRWRVNENSPWSGEHLTGVISTRLDARCLNFKGSCDETRAH